MSENYPAVVSRIEADPTKPWKAVASGAVSMVGTFIAWWVADEDPFTMKDAGEAFIAALAVGAPAFGLTYVVRNPLRSVDYHPAPGEGESGV